MRLAKYFLGELGRICAELKDHELPTRCDDAGKAEMLGYLAWSEKQKGRRSIQLQHSTRRNTHQRATYHDRQSDCSRHWSAGHRSHQFQSERLPDRESDPRQRPDFRGEISPVSFKRKVRDLIGDKDSQVWQHLQAEMSLTPEKFAILESRDRGFKDATSEEAWKKVCRRRSRNSR